MEPKEPFMPSQAETPKAESPEKEVPAKKDDGELVVFPDNTTAYVKNPEERKKAMEDWRENR